MWDLEIKDIAIFYNSVIIIKINELIMNEIVNEISIFWKNILKGRPEISKDEARRKLIELGILLHQLNGDNLIKAKLSSILFNMLKTLEMSPETNDDLKVTAIIVTERLNNIYYIYDKTMMKTFVRTNPWFFKEFRKAEVIAENEFYMMIKDKHPTNLGYLAHIILNKEKEVIHQRANQGEWATAFLNSIKE